MRRLLSAFVTAVLLLWAAQPASAQAVFPNQGSIGLVPPPGMTEVANVAGFEDRATKASILLVEVPPAVFEGVVTSFESDALQKQGVTVEQRRDIQLASGGKAVLLTGYQSVGAIALKKWILLARGKEMAGIVTVQFPETASATYPDAAVETALRSVVFRAPPTQAEMLARLPFTIANLEGYRVLKVLGGSAVLLTRAPEQTQEGEGHPFFIAGVAMGEIREDDRDSIAKRAIATVPGVKNLQVERGGPLRIGGQAGFELIAKGEDGRTGKPVKVAQWMRFGRTSYLRMIGVAPADSFDADFDGMRGLRDGIELR